MQAEERAIGAAGRLPVAALRARGVGASGVCAFLATAVFNGDELERRVMAPTDENSGLRRLTGHPAHRYRHGCG